MLLSERSTINKKGLHGPSVAQVLSIEFHFVVRSMNEVTVFSPLQNAVGVDCLVEWFIFAPKRMHSGGIVAAVCVQYEMPLVRTCRAPRFQRSGLKKRPKFLNEDA